MIQACATPPLDSENIVNWILQVDDQCPKIAEDGGEDGQGNQRGD